jgi:Tfp pilus assembly protein PilW
MIKMAMVRRLANRRGQAMVEFVIAAAVAVLLFAIMGFFFDMYLAYHYRILQLISSQYP